MSFSFSFIGPMGKEGNVWTVFCMGTQEVQNTTYDKALAVLRHGVATTKRVRPVKVWVRTSAVAIEYNIAPLVWAYSDRPDGPGSGAMCIGQVKMKDLLVTVDTHARMML